MIKQSLVCYLATAMTLASVESCLSQSNSFIVTDRATIRADFGILQAAAGPWFSRTAGNISEQHKYLLSENTCLLSGFGLDVQVFFRDRIGLELGIEKLAGYLDETVIQDEFYAHEQDYIVEIPTWSRHTGSYNYRYFKVGLVGYSSVGTIHVIPSLTYLPGMKTSYPLLEAGLTHRTSNEVLDREYLFHPLKSTGFKVGVAFRGYYRPFTKGFRNTNLFLQVRIEALHLRTSANAFFRDTAGSTSVSENVPFSQRHTAFLLGLTVGGIGWYR